MNKLEVVKAIKQFAPLDLQEEWDNSCMQICTCNPDIKTIMVALDINKAVVDEAIKKKVDFIVTHHPLFFEGIKTIKKCDSKGNSVIRLIQNNISVFSCHTPFDKTKGGINDYFLAKLGLKNIKQIDDYVRIGSFAKAITLDALAKKVAKVSKQVGLVKVQGDPKAKIKCVGMCSGSGGEMYSIAQDAGAEVFISGDIKHSVALEAKDAGMFIIDAGHYGTENCFIDDMYEVLSKKLGKKVKIIKSEANQNPFDYSI